MKPLLRIFLISLITSLSLIICNCENHGQSSGEPDDFNAIFLSINNPHKKLLELTVKGLVCESCKDALERLLKAENGVLFARVNLHKTTHNVTIIYDAQKITEGKLKQVIKDAGNEVVD